MLRVMGKVTTIHAVLQSAIDRVPGAGGPYHGGVDAKPRLGVLGHAGVALFLAESVASAVTRGDRPRYDHWLAIAREVYSKHLRNDVTIVKGEAWTRRSLDTARKLELQRELNQGKWGATYHPEQPTIRTLSPALHVGFVAALLAFDLEVGHGAGGSDPTVALCAAAGIAAGLAADGPSLVAELDRVMCREELRTMLYERNDPNAPRVTAWLWRAAKARKVTHVIGQLEDDTYVLTFKVGPRWRVFTGPRDEILATVPDEHLDAAVAAV